MRSCCFDPLLDVESKELGVLRLKESEVAARYQKHTHTHMYAHTHTHIHTHTQTHRAAPERE